MRIQFERSGGFAGVRLTATIDTEALAPEEAQKLRALMEDTDYFELPPVVTTPATGADRFQYKLTVEAEGKRHTVQIDEGAAPERLRPLLDWLTVAARQAKGR